MDADQVLEKWEEYLNNGDLLNISKLYASNAVLWGTFSKVIRNNSELIREYFQGLFQKQSLKVNFSSSSTRVYEDTHIYSGTYEFSYVEKELITFHARFTFIICKTKNESYKIVEHHSSLIPN